MVFREVAFARLSHIRDPNKSRRIKGGCCKDKESINHLQASCSGGFGFHDCLLSVAFLENRIGETDGWSCKSRWLRRFVS